MLVLALTSHTFARMQASQSIGPLLREIAYTLYVVQQVGA